MTHREKMNWARSLLLQESQQLQREYRHLKLKRRERELSEWERSRLTDLPGELERALSALSRSTVEHQSPFIQH